MGQLSERAPRTGSTSLLRRVLWVVGTGMAFVLLAVLGLGLASLLSPGDSAPAEPEAVRAPRPSPPPTPEPAPPPPPSAPAPVVEPPRPTPAVEPTPQHPVLPTPALTLPARLRLRRELVLGLGRLKEELARCSGEPVRRTVPGGRAALVLDAVVESDAVRVVGSRLEADRPVNDGFVSCARSVLEGKRLPVSGATTGVKLRLFLPLGPSGNSLSVPSASLTEAAQP